MKKTALLLAVLTAISCIREKTDPVPEEFDASVMTLDEGNYMASNAGITGYDPKSLESSANYFSVISGGESVMGDSPTCIYSYDGYRYITMSGSGKIHVYDPSAKRLVRTITGLSSPRYVCGYEDMLWVSDLFNGHITRISLPDMTPAESVETGGNAEMLIPYGDFIFTNFWNGDKRIARLDAATGQVLETLEVGVQPYSMALDSRNGVLWAYCDGGGWEGNPAGFENPSIYKIDVASSPMSVIKKIEIGDPAGYTFKLAIGTDRYGKPIDDWIYLINGDVYRMNRDNAELPETPFIDGSGRTFYSMAVSAEGEIYLTDAKDYVSDGECLRYDRFGFLIDSFTTGISPGFIYVE